jgi:hypothetical protein
LSVVTLRAANPPLDAELWLVHRLPDGTEEVQQLKQRVGEEFTFKPIVVPMTGANATVDVTGAVYQKYVNGIADGLSILIRRRVKTDGANAFELDGSSTSSIPTPSAGDVVSFPLPDPTSGRISSRGDISSTAGTRLQGNFSVGLAGHGFEIRLRVSPAKTSVPMF